MAIEELKEAVRCVGQTPALWISGMAAGLLASALWILLSLYGTFFATRLFVISGLVMIVFVAGSYAVIHSGERNARTLLVKGAQYYFRVLLPLLVVMFATLLIFVLILVTASFATGAPPDVTVLALISLFIMIPTFFLTFFSDTAAVFEETKVFDSIRRSIELTVAHTGEAIAFYLVCAILCFVDFFLCSVIWEGFLFSQLQPLTTYNETQLSAITPSELARMIGPDGMWITAVMIFIGLLFLLPLLLSYKAVFFKKIAGTPVPVRETMGEYDSKGRWYKY
ncbi:MAG: hypothetical protein ABFC71_02505 [Methanoregula sp.]